MSRRQRRREEGAEEMPRGPSRGSRAREAAEWAPRLLAQTAFLVGVVVVTTLVAELAGAANLGVALGIGQIAFAIALVTLMLTR